MYTFLIGFLVGVIGLIISSAGARRDNLSIVKLGDGIVWVAVGILILSFFVDKY